MVHKALDPLLKVLQGFVVPPLLEVAIFIIFAALVVEGMSQLMAHYDPHGAII